jgi:probable F420-dependent oxidoreductase
MRYGVTLPQNEIGNDPAIIKEFAQTAESLGYDHLNAYDHVLGANRRPEWEGQYRPYSHEHFFHEVFVLFGYLAAVTERIEFATGILVLPQRQAALVAKQAVEVDALSGGRFRLGVGVGWNDVEFEGMGENFRNRGKRIEEQVNVIRQLWEKPLIKFAGDYHTINDAGLNPLPSRKIPVWMGGGSDVVLRRMARMADGWFMHDGPIETVRGNIDMLHGYLRDEGRNPQDFGIDIRLSPTRVPEAEWETWIAERTNIGISDISIVVEGYGNGDHQSHIELMKRFREYCE